MSLGARLRRWCWLLLLATLPVGAAVPILGIDAGGHAGKTYSLVLTPDERYAVTVSYDKSIRIWDVASGALLRRWMIPVLDAEDGLMRAAALSPDGEVLAVGGQLRGVGKDMAVAFISLRDGRVLRTIDGLNGSVSTLAWSPDGRHFAIGFSPGQDTLRSVRNDSADIIHSALTGEFVVETGFRIYDTERWGAPLLDVPAEGRVTALGFADGGRFFAAIDMLIGGTGEVRLFRFERAGFIAQRTVRVERAADRRGSWSHRGDLIYLGGDLCIDADAGSETRCASDQGVSGNASGLLRFRDVAGRDQLYAVSYLPHAQQGFIRVYASRRAGSPYRDWSVPDARIADFAPLRDGRVIYVSDLGAVSLLAADGTPAWRVASAAGAFEGVPERLRVSADGRWLALPLPVGSSAADIAFNLFEPRFAAVSTVSSWQEPATGNDDLVLRAWRGTSTGSASGFYFPKLDRNEKALCAVTAGSGRDFVYGSDAGRVFKVAVQHGRPGPWSTVEALKDWWRDFGVPVTAVQLIESRGLVVVATSDGMVRLLRWKDGVTVLSYLLQPASRKWVAMADTGHYEAGIGSEDLLGWIVGRGRERTADFFPLSRFRDDYLVPGLAGAALELGSQEAALRQLLQSREVARVDGKGGSDADAESARQQAVRQADAVREAAAARLLAEQEAEAARQAQERLLIAAREAELRRAEAESLRQQAEEQRLAELARQAEAARAAELARLEALQQEELRRQQQLAAAQAELERLNALAAPPPPMVVLPDLQKLPPVVDVLSPGFDVATSERTLSVRYRISTPEGAPVTRVRGRVVASSQVSRAPLADRQGEDEQEIRFELPPEDAEVHIYAENRWGVSVPAVIRVRWQGARPGGGRPRGVLHVVAVGVSEYDNPDYRLGFAAKDARDFADEIRKQEGGLYTAVRLHVLTDQAAGKQGIERALLQLREAVTARDTTMVFLAGHGINDAGGEYLYLPREAELGRLRETGVSFRQIGDVLASLPGRTVMFVDTCHSGNVVSRLAPGQSRNNTAAVNELASSEKNIIVFASSTGEQASLEYEPWGNGAFTKALLEGFGGKADLLRRGRVTYKQLDAYVSDRVEELTEGKQTPVTPVLVTVPDFTLAEIRR